MLKMRALPVVPGHKRDAGAAFGQRGCCRSNCGCQEQRPRTRGDPATATKRAPAHLGTLSLGEGFLQCR